MSIGLLPLLRTDPVVFVLVVVALVLAIALHEYAHALAADLQGDRLPRAMGRLTLNPIKHLDPLGTVFLVIAGFGWGKPVEFRPSALASKRFGGAAVALAGPAMNALLGFVSAVLLVLLARHASQSTVAIRFLATFMSINILLAIFNLLPIPPLDGSRLLTIFLPPSRQHILYFLDRYGFLILVVVIVFGGTSVLAAVTDRATSVVLDIANALT